MFRAISLSHKTASVAIREQVYFSDKESSDFLCKLKDILGIEEALVLSTCNRTEVYFSSQQKKEHELIRLIASTKGISSSLIEAHFKVFTNSAEVTEHLFRVALGLESSVLGDIQIINQIKKAYQLSADNDMAGPFLHRLLHTVFYANKRAIQETALHDGNASLASVAVETTRVFASKVADPQVALIGMGEIGQNVLENLKGEQVRIVLVNRTKERLKKWAENLEEAEIHDFSRLDEVIERSDVIISAVSSSHPIISEKEVSENLIHKLFIDMSVPRSIDPSIGMRSGIQLHNIDDLTEKTRKAKSLRMQAVPHAEQIVKESIRNFEEWKNEMEVSPAIQRLKKALEQIRKEELARYSSVNENERELLEVVTKNMVQKVIKLPVLHLKAACKRGEVDTLVGVLNDLFNLEETPTKK